MLSHYVNRRGDNVPSELITVGELSLWLMAGKGRWDGYGSEMVTVLESFNVLPSRQRFPCATRLSPQIVGCSWKS